MKTERFTIRISPELKKQMEEIAKTKEISASSWVTLLIKKEIDAQYKDTEKP